MYEHHWLKCSANIIPQTAAESARIASADDALVAAAASGDAHARDSLIDPTAARTVAVHRDQTPDILLGIAGVLFFRAPDNTLSAVCEGMRVDPNERGSGLSRLINNTMLQIMTKEPMLKRWRYTTTSAVEAWRSIALATRTAVIWENSVIRTAHITKLCDILRADQRQLDVLTGTRPSSTRLLRSKRGHA